MSGLSGAPSVEMIQELVYQRTPLLKFGRKGTPHFRDFQLSEDLYHLNWISRAKATSRSTFDLREARLLRGQQTALFRKKKRKDLERFSFSLENRRTGRTLDLVASDKKQYDVWTSVLEFLTITFSQGEDPKGMQRAGEESTGRRQSSLTKGSISLDGPMTIQERLSRLSQLSDNFGSSIGGGSAFSARTGGTFRKGTRRARTNTLLPGASSKGNRKLVSTSSGNSLLQGLNSAQGIGADGKSVKKSAKNKMAEKNEAYSFGFGGWGELGQGVKPGFQFPEDSNVEPKVIKALLGKNVIEVAAGFMHCGALTDNGELYMWGNGHCGKLGTHSHSHLYVLDRNGDDASTMDNYDEESKGNNNLNNGTNNQMQTPTGLESSIKKGTSPKMIAAVNNEKDSYRLRGHLRGSPSSTSSSTSGSGSLYSSSPLSSIRIWRSKNSSGGSSGSGGPRPAGDNGVALGPDSTSGTGDAMVSANDSKNGSTVAGLGNYPGGGGRNNNINPNNKTHDRNNGLPHNDSRQLFAGYGRFQLGGTRAVADGQAGILKVRSQYTPHEIQPILIQSPQDEKERYEEQLRLYQRQKEEERLIKNTNNPKRRHQKRASKNSFLKIQGTLIEETKSETFKEEDEHEEEENLAVNHDSIQDGLNQLEEENGGRLTLVSVADTTKVSSTASVLQRTASEVSEERDYYESSSGRTDQTPVYDDSDASDLEEGAAASSEDETSVDEDELHRGYYKPCSYDFISLACGDQHTLALETETGVCYSWGSGAFGQLGLGELCLDQDSPQRVKVLRPSQRQLEEAEQQAKEQQAAEEQMISSSESGTVDLHGAEVATHDDKDTNARTRIKDTKETQDNNDGDNDSKKTTATNNTNKSTALGTYLSHSASSSGSLWESLFWAKRTRKVWVEKIAASNSFSALISDANELFTFGNGDTGCLGHGDFNDVFKPKRVEFFEQERIRVLGVTCGDFHLAVVGEMDHNMGISQEASNQGFRRRLFTCGSNDCGQLGRGAVPDCNIPCPVERLDGYDIVMFAAGSAHMLCVVVDDQDENVKKKVNATKNDGSTAKTSPNSGATTTTSAMNTSSPSNVNESNSYMAGITGYMYYGSKSATTGANSKNTSGTTSSELATERSGSNLVRHVIYSWGAGFLGQNGHNRGAGKGRGHHLNLPRRLHFLDGTQGTTATTGASGSQAAASTNATKRDAESENWSSASGTVEYISCGSNHSGVVVRLHRNNGNGPGGVTSDGMDETNEEKSRLFMWGDNRFGQCGIVGERIVKRPQLVKSLAERNVRSVTCGGRHTIVTVARMWIKDKETTACMHCNTPFTTFNRRHHCRRCGGIFCGKCSSKKVALLKLHIATPVRVCDPCFLAVSK
eukprot:g1044.t1